jgi:hypothetical protein
MQPLVARKMIYTDCQKDTYQLVFWETIKHAVHHVGAYFKYREKPKGGRAYVKETETLGL